MLVQMITHITGFRNGQPWPVPPGTIDLPDGEAADMIAAGHARIPEEDATDETDTIEPAGTDPADADVTAADESDAEAPDEPVDAAPTPDLIAPAKNAQRDEWAAYAIALGVSFDDDANRSVIIEAVEQAATAPAED